MGKQWFEGFNLELTLRTLSTVASFLKEDNNASSILINVVSHNFATKLSGELRIEFSHTEEKLADYKPHLVNRESSSTAR